MSTATEFVPARIHGRRARSSTAVVLPMTRTAGPRGRVVRGWHPAAAPGPARNGSRLRPHRPRPRRPRRNHPTSRPRRHRGRRRTCGTRSPNPYDAWWDKRAPERTRAERAAAARARGRAAGGTGAPEPPSTTASSTPLATGPKAAGAPPPAPASPTDFNPPTRSTGRGAHKTDQRTNPDLIHDVLDALDRHGYARTDDEHTARAVLLISDLARVYEGALDHRSAHTTSSRCPGPKPRPNRARRMP